MKRLSGMSVDWQEDSKSELIFSRDNHKPSPWNPFRKKFISSYSIVQQTKCTCVIYIYKVPDTLRTTHIWYDVILNVYPKA